MQARQEKNGLIQSLFLVNNGSGRATRAFGGVTRDTTPRWRFVDHDLILSQSQSTIDIIISELHLLHVQANTLYYHYPNFLHQYELFYSINYLVNP